MSGSRFGYGEAENIKLKGTTRVEGFFAVGDGGDEVPVEDVIDGAQKASSVITVPDAFNYVVPRDVVDGVFLVPFAPTTATNRFIEIGQPSEETAGRRLRFILKDNMRQPSAAARNTDIRVAASGAANQKIFGVVIRGATAATGGEALINLRFDSDRAVRFLSDVSDHFAPKRGDWVEFLDVGDYWMLSGAVTIRTTLQKAGIVGQP